MRGSIIAIVIAGLAGIGHAVPSASVHVTVSAPHLDAKAHADRVRTRAVYKLAQAKLPATTFDLSVSESVSTLSRRQVQITIELCMAMSDRSGRVTSIVRTAASAKGSIKSLAVLRDEVTASAIDAAIVRARAGK